MRALTVEELSSVAGGYEQVELTRIVVTGTRLQNTFTSADIDYIFSEFSSGGDKGGGLEDHEGPIEDGPGDNGAAEFLESNAEFNKLPEALQQLILNSPSAAAVFAQFYAQGGTVTGANIEGARYFDGNPPRIEISQSLMNMAADAQARGDTGSATYYSRQMAGLLAHEVGHFMTDHLDWDNTGNLSEYVTYRTRLESLAIFASMQMITEMGVDFPHGYGSPLGLRGLYEDYQRTGDWNGLMNTLDSWVRNFAWDGSDVNGDGVINQVDLYTTNFPGGGG